MGRISSKTRVVCDAGPIIHLDELDCLNLIEDFEMVFVPDVVRKEVLVYKSVAFEDSNVSWSVIPHQFTLDTHVQPCVRFFLLTQENWQR